MALSPATSLLKAFPESVLATLKLSNPELLRSTNYINGEWVASGRQGEEATFPVRNPSTDEIVGYAPDLDPSEVRLAIEAADAARHGWAATTAKVCVSRRIYIFDGGARQVVDCLRILRPAPICSRSSTTS